MTLDEQIGEAIDRGDINAACLLAAQIEKPQWYRDTMIAIHQIIDARTKGDHLSTEHEAEAVKSVSEKFMFGDLLKVLMAIILYFTYPRAWRRYERQA